ncbi:MAG: hypothetical protein HWN65_01145 [Candidatus Helarchaeota archaeon]|nr:hypothetical protein [Candidatus Helarchaeota archaeon]
MLKCNKLLSRSMLIFLILVIGFQVSGLSRSKAYIAGPDPIGTWETPDPLDAVMDVIVNGTLAYLAIDGFGLQILNLTDPTNPTPRGSHLITGAIKCIAASFANDRVYISAGSTLHIINSTDPDSPSEITTHNMGATVYGIAANYPYIYVGAYNDSFKVANETHGVMVEALTSPTPWIPDSFWCYQVVYSGNYVYAAGYDKGVIVFNVTNPYSPALVGFEFLAADIYSIAHLGGNRCVAGGSAGYLAIVDVSNASDPTKTGEIDTAGGNVVDIAIYSTYAICADTTYGIVTLSCIGASPTEIARLAPTMNGYGAETDAMYVYGAGGLSDFKIWEYSGAISGSLFEIPGFLLLFSLFSLIAIGLFGRLFKRK